MKSGTLTSHIYKCLEGHAYLIAVMDWHTRAVLSWEVCNTMDTALCLRALRKAFKATGR
ncbi:MAG: DDE-type integrase/transposase/recombinase [Rubritalea sp.]|uniref:DDE-type integrase/transposase/recombinase n=1 Tax=Rubritalea sp. TaxID=2109375 RepID=UPI0032423D1B